VGSKGSNEVRVRPAKAGKPARPDAGKITIKGDGSRLRIRVRPPATTILHAAVPVEIHAALKAYAANERINIPTALTRVLATSLGVKGHGSDVVKTY
jgi:hypothetical protein